MTRAVWYFVSPFAHLRLARFQRLPDTLAPGPPLRFRAELLQWRLRRATR